MKVNNFQSASCMNRQISSTYERYTILHGMRSLVNSCKFSHSCIHKEYCLPSFNNLFRYRSERRVFLFFIEKMIDQGRISYQEKKKKTDMKDIRKCNEQKDHRSWWSHDTLLVSVKALRTRLKMFSSSTIIRSLIYFCHTTHGIIYRRRVVASLPTYAIAYAEPQFPTDQRCLPLKHARSGGHALIWGR